MARRLSSRRPSHDLFLIRGHSAVERFPALRLILRFGRLGALAVALAATALIVAFVWSYFGWLSLILAPFALVATYFLAKSYVEIIQIITEMVH